MTNNDFVLAALKGSVVVDIGQIDGSTRRALNREVAKGALMRWRGFWYPVAGASHGLGPLKTCWAVPEVRKDLL